MNIDRYAAQVIQVACVVAGISIISTAIALAPDTCVDEKVANAQLILEKAKIINDNYIMKPNTCVEYKSTNQILCRKRAGSQSTGSLYIKELNTDGKMISEGDE